VILPAIDNHTTPQSTGASTLAEEFERGDECDDPLSEEHGDTVLAREAVPQRRAITAFASGTVLAGIAGFGYKALLFDLCAWRLEPKRHGVERFAGGGRVLVRV
jgi:hypothetical protein